MQLLDDDGAISEQVRKCNSISSSLWFVDNGRVARDVLEAYLCEVLHAEASPCAAERRASRTTRGCIFFTRGARRVGERHEWRALR